MEKQDINIKKSFSRDEFINELLSEAGSMPSAAYGDGFWADHWTYYLDMINSYLSIFPEREEQLMFGEGLPYFYSPATVHPRDEKYVETPIESGNGFHIQQLGATTWDTEKESKQVSERSERALRKEDENTREIYGSREMAEDIMATSTTKLTHKFVWLACFARACFIKNAHNLASLGAERVP